MSCMASAVDVLITSYRKDLVALIVKVCDIV